jgi:hypothetical protein
VLQLLVSANVIPSSPIPLTLVMEVIRSSKMSVNTTSPWHNIPEAGILWSHRRENLKSYVALTGWSLLRRRNIVHVKYELGFHMPEGGMLHSHRRENLKSYIYMNWLDLAARIFLFLFFIYFLPIYNLFDRIGSNK